MWVFCINYCYRKDLTVTSMVRIMTTWSAGGASLCKTEPDCVINLRPSYTSYIVNDSLPYVFLLAFCNIGCKRTDTALCTKSDTRRLSPSAQRLFVSVYNAEVSQLYGKAMGANVNVAEGAIRAHTFM